MPQKEKIQNLKNYMLVNFQVTPENIDLKLKELKESLNNKSGQAKS